MILMSTDLKTYGPFFFSFCVPRGKISRQMLIYHGIFFSVSPNMAIKSYLPQHNVPGNCDYLMRFDLLNKT